MRCVDIFMLHLHMVDISRCFLHRLLVFILSTIGFVYLDPCDFQPGYVQLLNILDFTFQHQFYNDMQPMPRLLAGVEVIQNT